jgi:hypothetical protein
MSLRAGMACAAIVSARAAENVAASRVATGAWRDDSHTNRAGLLCGLRQRIRLFVADETPARVTAARRDVWRRSRRLIHPASLATAGHERRGVPG